MIKLVISKSSCYQKGRDEISKSYTKIGIFRQRCYKQGVTQDMWNLSSVLLHEELRAGTLARVNVSS